MSENLKKLVLLENLIRGSRIQTIELTIGDQHYSLSQKASPSKSQSENSSSNIPLENYEDITSSQVGFFFFSKELKIGDNIKKSEKIGQIKSLGLNSSVISKVTGNITNIFIKEGQPVEYGQPLFRLRK